MRLVSEVERRWVRKSNKERNDNTIMANKQKAHRILKDAIRTLAWSKRRLHSEMEKNNPTQCEDERNGWKLPGTVIVLTSKGGSSTRPLYFSFCIKRSSDSAAGARPLPEKETQKEKAKQNNGWWERVMKESYWSEEMRELSSENWNFEMKQERRNEKVRRNRKGWRRTKKNERRYCDFFLALPTQFSDNLPSLILTV